MPALFKRQETERALTDGQAVGDSEATAFHDTGASPYKKLVQVGAARDPHTCEAAAKQ